MKILMPSIVDPTSHRGGAGTVTRGFLSVLRQPPLCASIDTLVVEGGSPARQRLRRFASLARSLFSDLPAKVGFSYTRSFRERVRAKIREEDPSLVLINGADLLWILDEVPPTIPCVLLAHNLEHELFRSQIESLRCIRGLFRSFLERDCARLKAFELEGMERVGNIVFLSHADADAALRVSSQRNVAVFPPMFADASRSLPREVGKDRMLHLGFLANLDWWPNRQGLRWFLRRVLPGCPDVQLHVFGEGAVRAARGHPRVVPHGFVTDLREVWSQCDVMICPIRSGGGVNIKVAESLYNGMPILATPFSLKGYQLEGGPGIVCLESAYDWCRYLRSQHARDLRNCRIPEGVRRSFSAREHAPRVQAFFEAVVSARRTRWRHS